MKIKTRMVNDVAIISLSGKLLGGPPASDEIKNEVYRLLDEGVRKFVFDMEGVSRMNSSGLGILISALSSIKNRGGEMKLAAVNETMEGVLVSTKLNTIFEIYGTAEGAAQSFHD
ncbi:MAG: STAS domain-containing protein [candidate division KSB1 bacterium]|nr:STAS domain-containing protein [candidate division KSB1 bacterium]